MRRALRPADLCTKLLGVIAVGFAIPRAALGQDPESPVEIIVDTSLGLIDAIRNVSGVLGTPAIKLFIALAALELIWTAYDALLRRGLDIQDSLLIFTKRLLLLAILLVILTYAPLTATGGGAWALIEDFYTLGGQVVNRADLGLSPDEFNPSGFLDAFIDFLRIAFEGLDEMVPAWWAWFSAKGLALMFALGTIIGSFLWIGFSLLIVTLEGYFIAAVGFFSLAFAGNRLTIPIAERFPALLIRYCLKVLVLFVMIAVGFNLLDIWSDALQEGDTWIWDDLFVYVAVGVCALSYAFLTWRLSRLMAELVPTAGESVVPLRQLFAD